MISLCNTNKQCSHDENFKFLNRKDDGSTAIELLNPATIEFQVVRTSLLPGLLKTIRENKGLPLPLKVFEVSDICLQDPSQERKARNDRRMGAVFTDKKAGFEMVHGLLDRVMQTLSVPFLQSGDSKGEYGYYIAQSDGMSLTTEYAALTYRTYILAWTRSQGHVETSKIGRDHYFHRRVQVSRRTSTLYRSQPKSRSSRRQIPLRLPCIAIEPGYRHRIPRYPTPNSPRQLRTCPTMFCFRD